MSVKQLAAKLPENIIRELVEENVIARAVVNATDAYMDYLFVLWYNYYEPNGQGNKNCPYCLNNILNNFKGMQDAIVELYREQKQLESL